MKYIVHGSKNQNDSNFQLSEFAETNEQRSICFYRSLSRIGCPWPDPDTSNNRAPPWIVIRDKNCPPSTPISFRRYLGQVTDNQCVINICRSRSKRLSFVSANSLQSKFKIITFISDSAYKFQVHINNVEYKKACVCKSYILYNSEM